MAQIVAAAQDDFENLRSAALRAMGALRGALQDFIDEAFDMAARVVAAIDGEKVVSARAIKHTRELTRIAPSLPYSPNFSY